MHARFRGTETQSPFTRARAAGRGDGEEAAAERGRCSRRASQGRGEVFHDGKRPRPAPPAPPRPLLHFTCARPRWASAQEAECAEEERLLQKAAERSRVGKKELELNRRKREEAELAQVSGTYAAARDGGSA